MKIALINDIHFGIRNDAQFLLNYQERFFKEVFFPELEKNNVRDVLIGGDIFDRRKYINFVTAKRANEMMFDILEERKIDVHIIPGNHDLYFKSTNEVSSLDALLTRYDNVFLYDVPYTLELGSSSIDLIPWINNNNYASTVDFINKSSSEFCYGHFEIKGFEMYRGVTNDHGMDMNMFSKYKDVWSGHFHCKSEKGNIKYLGAPMEFTFSDCDDARGFHIFDTEKKSLTFNQNPITLHQKFYYNDEEEDAQDQYRQLDYSQFENKIVKLIVVKKTFPALFENMIDQLVQVDGISLTIQEDFSGFHSDNVDDIEKSSTRELMEDYVDNVDTQMDKVRIKGILNNTYVEAQNQEIN